MIVVLQGGAQDGQVIDLLFLIAQYPELKASFPPREIVFPVATGKPGITSGPNKRIFWNSVYQQTEEANKAGQTIYKYKGLEKA